MKIFLPEHNHRQAAGRQRTAQPTRPSTTEGHTGHTEGGCVGSHTRQGPGQTHKYEDVLADSGLHATAAVPLELPVGDLKAVLRVESGPQPHVRIGDHAGEDARRAGNLAGRTQLNASQRGAHKVPGSLEHEAGRGELDAAALLSGEGAGADAEDGVGSHASYNVGLLHRVRLRHQVDERKVLSQDSLHLVVGHMAEKDGQATKHAVGREREDDVERA